MIHDLWLVLTGRLSWDHHVDTAAKLGAANATIEYMNQELHRERIFCKNKVEATLAGIGRIIARLEPIYGKDELDPARKAESDKLGEAVIKRLEAENKARKHTLGEL